MRRYVINLLLLISATTITAFAQQLPIAPFTKFLAEGMAYRVQAVDDRVYAACGSMLVILDGNESQSVALQLGRVDIGDIISDFCVQGNLAFLSTKHPGLRILDVADAANPQIIGSCSVAGRDLEPEGGRGRMAKSGPYIYICSDSAFVRIYTIGDTLHPQFVDTLSISTSFPRSLATADNRLYVGTDDQRVIAYECVDSLTTYLGETRLDTGRPWDMVLRDTLLYAAFDQGGLQIFNVSGSIPQQVGPGSSVLGRVALGIAAEGTRLTVATGLNSYPNYPGGLFVFDITTPMSPMMLGHFERNGDHAYGAAISNNWAYLGAQSNGIIALDITNPTLNPLPPAWTDTTDSFSGNFPLGIFVQDTLVFVANYHKGLDIIGTRIPGSPHRLGEIRVSGHANRVFVQNNYAYVSAYDNNTVSILNINDPHHPVCTGIIDNSGVGSVQGVYISDNYAFLVGNTGLAIWNVVNASNPQPVSTFAMTGAKAVAVAGSYVYAVTSSTLKIVDVSNPNSPQENGNLAIQGPLERVVVSGSTAFITSRTTGLTTVNISNPAAPTLLANISEPPWMSGINIMGNFLFVAAGSDGILAYDVLNPANPVLAGECATIGHAEDIVVTGSHAYTADKNAGCAVLDISSFVAGLQPTVLIMAAQCQTCGNGIDFPLLFNPAANYAYHTLSTIKTYGSGRVYYSSAFPWQDLNGDSENDYIVDETDTTTAGVQAAIDNLTASNDPYYPGLIYLAGVGEENAIRLNDSGARLRADTLAAWLNRDSLERPGHPLVVIVNASHSGSFLNDLARANRIVITTTDSSEVLASNTHGLPFDSVFWQQIASGETIWYAFQSARQRLGNLQTPLLDANGDGVANQDSDSVAASIGLGIPVSMPYVSTGSATLPGVVDVPDTVTNDGVDLHFNGTMDAVWYNLIPIGYNGTPPLESLPHGPLFCMGGNRYKSAPIDSSLPDTAVYVIQVSGVRNHQISYPSFSIYADTSDGAVSEASAIPQAFRLSQNYPNPFNPETRFEFVVPRPARVTLEVWNILGQRVFTLADRRFDAGQHIVTWNGNTSSGYPVVSGVYFLTMKSDDFRAVRKMIMLR